MPLGLFNAAGTGAITPFETFAVEQARTNPTKAENPAPRSRRWRRECPKADS